MSRRDYRPYYSMLKNINKHTLLAGSLLIFIACASCKRGSRKDAPAQLAQLLKDEWEYELKSNPESATYLGDARYNAELTDYSPAGLRKNADRLRGFLRQFEQVDPRALSPQDDLNRTLMIRRLRDGIEAFSFKDWEMPADQMNGVHLAFAQLPGYTRFANLQDYNDYLNRLKKLPAAFQQIEEDMRLGVTDRLLPPQYLLAKVAVQSQRIAAAPPEGSPFAVPLKKFPEAVSTEDRERLRSAILSAIKTEVAPAYDRFARFVHGGYAPHARTEPGIWSLPDGAARYTRAIRLMTTTNLSPEEFHQIGLSQVNEIEAQMLELARSQGYNDLKTFNAFIKSDKRFYPASGEQILGLYKTYLAAMQAQMPKLFGRTPKASLDIVPMEEFRAKDAAPADYSPGSADGKRAGRINVNEWDPTHRLTLNIEAVAYHEGIPGHHQQMGLAQELSGLPDFRKNSGYNAFVEGWALYAERLGKEVGFYKDPYSEYGRLENEMWRAVRLVVDTGVHYKHWSRQQMVDFFHAHTAIDEPSVQSETDRYIAWPAQALGYKAGQIKILQLREKARGELGGKFNLRSFHDAVLENGALPLDVLETKVNAWIAGSKQ